MAHRYHKSVYTPKNPQKYVGNKKPVCRSSWERRFCMFCDENSSIKQWASESIKIPYTDPHTGKRRHYTPDFLIQYVDAHGKMHNELIEVKPKNQTFLKEAGRSKRNKVATEVNHAKWQSAVAFCDRVGLVFRVITEDELFVNTKRK